MKIFDTTKCFVCEAKIKRKGSSLHVWDVEYECGCRIFGAIDTDTHGDEIDVANECPNLNKIAEKYKK